MTSLADSGAMTAFLLGLGIEPAEPLAITELTGGVSSRVLNVATADGTVIVKQALAELRVERPWAADVARADVEVDYGRAVHELVPGACPRVIAHDPVAHAFVMAPAPEGSEPWKAALMRGRVSLDAARKVGRTLGLVHERAARAPGLRERFADRTHFDALRVEPYLGDVRDAHPDRAEAIDDVIAFLRSPGETLVHGDVSPKNILVGPDADVLLIDHEVAHWGRAAFDTAFVVNHLCLKAIHRPARVEAYLGAAEALLDAYAEAAPVHGAGRKDTGVVLAPLLLARVDGRSPVEYLDERGRDQVRAIARTCLAEHDRTEGVLGRVRQACADGRNESTSDTMHEESR